MPLSQGQILNNRYRIVNLLGQGGMGAVYKVWDLNLKRPRALKENLDVSPEAQRQFEREAQMLADLSHPNLPKVIDYFSIPGQGQYLVMEFVEGKDLDEMQQLTGGPLPEDQAQGWIEQACLALEYLHSHTPPIIHRDIKPANIRINPQGQAMLVDFGIAKVYDPQLKTTMGARAVTPGYSPPEQYGQAATDPRSDIYALGATFYTLLTGQKPTESVLRSAGAPLSPPQTLNPAISDAANSAILWAMALKPEDRPQNAAQFKMSLAPTPARVDPIQLAASLATVRPGAAPIPAPTIQPAPKRTSASRLWVAAGALLVALVAVVGGLWIYSGQQRGALSAQSSLVTQTAMQNAIQATLAGLTSGSPPATLTPTVQPTGTPTQVILVVTATSQPTLETSALPGAPPATSTMKSSPVPPGTVTPTLYYVYVEIDNKFNEEFGQWMDCIAGPCMSLEKKHYYFGSKSRSAPIPAGTYSITQRTCGKEKAFTKILDRYWLITVYKCK